MVAGLMQSSLWEPRRFSREKKGFGTMGFSNVGGKGLMFMSVLAWAPLGCYSAIDVEEDTKSGGPTIASIESDLMIGSQGEDVRALNAYLTRYGYFPSDELARNYPNLVAVVPMEPAEPDVFDEQTYAAVRALQMRAGLTPTGVVDAATREKLAEPRCGVPDGYQDHNLTEKFAYGPSKWNGKSLTWKLTNNAVVITTAQARTAIAAAFASWATETDLTFTEVTGTGTADILLTFAAIDGGGVFPGNVLARTGFPGNGGDMTIDNGENWSVSGTTTPQTVDFQTVMLHELGHALGLNHSSVSGATMGPFGSYGKQDRSLNWDDNTAISALYDTWKSIPGAARDIAVAGDGSGTAWAIGNTADSGGGGFSIHKWNGSSWDTVTGVATRIALTGDGVPWVVDAFGTIWRGSISSTGTWTQLPGGGCATDIGAGLEGAVWVIGCDGGVFKWNPSMNKWENANGAGSRIAVTRKGIPWVVQSGGQIFRRTSSSATSGSWEQMPGSASDIGALDAVWAIGRDSVSGGSSIFVWNEQSEIKGSDGTVHAPAQKQWIKVTGGANNISVGYYGPWVTQTNFSIFRQFRLGTIGVP